MVSANHLKKLQNVLPNGNPFRAQLCYPVFTFVSLRLGVFVLNLSASAMKIFGRSLVNSLCVSLRPPRLCGSIVFLFASLLPCDFALSFSHFALHFRRMTPSHPLRRHDNDDAADIREQSAALAPFQRLAPSNPPTQKADSAASPVLPARHFGGKYAKFAIGVLA